MLPGSRAADDSSDGSAEMSSRLLRHELLRPLMATGFGLAVALVALSFVTERIAAERAISERLGLLARTLELAQERAAKPGALQAFIDGLGDEHGLSALALLTDGGERILAGTRGNWKGLDLVSVPELVGGSSLSELLGSKEPGLLYDERQDEYVYVAPIAAGSEAARLQASHVLVRTDARLSIREAWRGAAHLSYFLVGLLGLLAVVLWRSVDRQVSRPLRELGRAVSRHKAGGSAEQLPESGSTVEIRDLRRDLEDMIDARNEEYHDLQRSEAELRLLGQVARIADRAEDFDEALRACCEEVCEFLGWPTGHVYLVDEWHPGQISPSEIWYHADADGWREFTERTSNMVFSPGEGLPGRVWQRKEPVWVSDTRKIDWFSRAEVRSPSVRAAVGFPIFMAQDVIGVLELFDTKPREREIRPMALMHNIGLTLGQVLHRRRTHELLVSSNRELASALETATSATQAKSAFLANMSHEIRTPMTAILGYANLIASADEEDERQEYLSTILRNGEHLLQLINDILDLSKIEARRLTVERLETPVNDLVMGVYELLEGRAREKGLDFELIFDGMVPTEIETDPTRVHQILLNLVSNSVKFTDDGFVRVRVGLASDRTAEVPLLRFSVQDSGIGMSQKQIDRLFRPFSQADDSTTRRYGGTGLGLSICRSLVELMGGVIEIKSDESGGSEATFTIATGSLDGIEFTDQPPDLSPRTHMRTLERVDVRLDGLRVLLAEDGVDNQRLIGKFVSVAGAKVEVVENGALALDRALEASRTVQPFDVILMDMQMPVMDGYDATRALRSEGYRGPILALTAHAMRGDREKCLQAGCDDFLSKPVKRALLIQAIAAAVEVD